MELPHRLLVVRLMAQELRMLLLPLVLQGKF
jgi:hypothetical protein